MIRECPSCREPLGWSQKFRTSGFLSSRPVTPCPRCATSVRRSAMASVSRGFAIALLATLVTELLVGVSTTLALLTLVLALFTLATGLATTLEVATGAEETP